MEEKKSYPLIALRQCAARLVAAAVCRLFPHARMIRGEATDSGFYYDFDLEPPFTKEAFPMIEEHLRVLLTENTPYRSHTMMVTNAQELFAHNKQPLKCQVIEQMGEVIDLIQIGDFYDECPEPHPGSLQELKALHLLDVKNLVIFDPDLGETEVVRVFGTVFPSSQVLKHFLKEYQKQQKRKVLSPGLLIEEVADGEEFMGAKLLGQIENFRNQWLDHCREGGTEVISSPTLQRRSFLEAYGLEGYGEGEWVLPPTQAPAHFAYITEKKVYKVGEFCRFTQDLADHQLVPFLRGRSYWMDQEHLLCDPAEVVSELISSLHFLNKSLKMLSIEGKWVLNSFGKRTKRTSKRWESALKWLAEAWERSDLTSHPLEEGDGGGLDPIPFVGPRIEVHFVDSLGRQWRGPYVGIWVLTPKSEKPMIERSLFGSVERLIGLMLDKG